MNPPDALLSAILAAPWDDAPRLASADWFEEDGRPERARLVRLQCVLEDRAGRVTAADRLRLPQALAVITPPVIRAAGGRGRPRPIPVQWSRGYPFAAEIRLGEDIPLLREMPTLEALDLPTATLTEDHLLDWLGLLPNLRRLTVAGVRSNDPAALLARLFAASPRLDAVNSRGPCPAGWVDLVREARLAAPPDDTPGPVDWELWEDPLTGEFPGRRADVVRLIFPDAGGLGPGSLAAFTGLRVLDMQADARHTPLSDLLAALRDLPHLETLRLTLNDAADPGGTMDADALLDAVAALPRLRSLDTAPVELTEAQRQRLASLPHLRETRVNGESPTADPPVPTEVPGLGTLQLPARLQPAEWVAPAELADAVAGWSWREPEFPDEAPGRTDARAAVDVSVHPWPAGGRADGWLAHHVLSRPGDVPAIRKGRLTLPNGPQWRSARVLTWGTRIVLVRASVGVDRLYPWAEVLDRFVERPMTS